ncbi:sulfotransferase family protein [Hartmannibacter diazotrophicus]|nr:sulfotransferase [Hartmannibacter diazotrophicus]
MQQNELDFLIIGAQEGGTTALHEILATHPQIQMAIGKERTFFDRDDGDWDQFADEVFEKDRPAGVLIGKATPQYISAPGVAPRIRAMFPDVRLIAILRNPVARTFSHYRMCVRRGMLDDNFDAHVDRWLNREELIRARELPHEDANEADCCVVWSEYSRMLDRYLAVFPKESLLVVLTEDLEGHPDETISKIMTHLGLDPAWRSEIAHQKFHVGGDKKKVSLPPVLKALPGVKTSLRWFFSRLPPKLAYMYQMWNIVPSKSDGAEQYPEAFRKLQAHFSSEGRDLQERFGITPNW